MNDGSAAGAARTAQAERLRRRALGPDGLTPSDLRAAAFTDRTTGGAIDGVVDRIRTSAPEVTDEQIADLVDAVGGEPAAFEIVVVASLGAGLERWDAALRAIEEARDAAV